MTMYGGEQLLRAFVRFVPHALEALTALEHLVVRLFFFGLMIYGLFRWWLDIRQRRSGLAVGDAGVGAMTLPPMLIALTLL
jgi:apolipoprotein N-acyltransferase